MDLAPHPLHSSYIHIRTHTANSRNPGPPDHKPSRQPQNRWVIWLPITGCGSQANAGARFYPPWPPSLEVRYLSDTEVGIKLHTPCPQQSSLRKVVTPGTIICVQARDQGRGGGVTYWMAVQTNFEDTNGPLRICRRKTNKNTKQDHVCFV